MRRVRRLSWAGAVALGTTLIPAGASAATTCQEQSATIVGTGGADELEGTAGVDIIVGLGGDDHIVGLRGRDIICGGSGRDAIRTGPGSDFVSGGDGDDVLIAEGGDDRVLGGRGDDHLMGQRGDDRLGGGAGIDTAGYFDADIPGGITVDLTAGASSGSHGVDTLDSLENVDGSPWHDVLIGDSGPNHLRAYARLDRLDGRNGDDVLRGGGGEDRLDGGRGADDCDGEVLNRCD